MEAGSSPGDALPLFRPLPGVRANGIGHQGNRDLDGGQLALGPVVMPRVAVLILHEKAKLPVPSGLDVGHLGRAQNEIRFIPARVERVHLSPDISLCWILDLPSTANI